MPKGCKREGAGRPKGAQNKATAEREAKIAASGLTPLDYMLALLRDESRDEAQRFEAAKAAAPYVHPRLSTIDASIEGGLHIVIDDSDDDPAS
jgi:hypothetical protein